MVTWYNIGMSSDPIMRQELESGPLLAGATDTLNRHGHPFQLSVIRAISEASKQHKQDWTLEAAEVPVSVNGRTTRIDAVFARGGGPMRSFLVVETKRVNPRLGQWCFAHRQPESIGHIHGQNLYFGHHRIQLTGGHSVATGTRLIAAFGKEFQPQASCYAHGFEVKSIGQHGDTGGNNSSRRAIDDACYQLCLGLNGLVEYFAGLYSPGPVFEVHANLLPVLVTSAALYVSDVDMSTSDLETGNLNSSQLKFSRVDYLYYSYPQDAEIIHSLSRVSRHRRAGLPTDPQPTHESPFQFFDLKRDMRSNYVQTILIVTASAIDRTLERWATGR